MKNLFSKELANASEMYQVQNGVQRVLRAFVRIINR
jgi:hypothetical protein